LKKKTADQKKLAPPESANSSYLRTICSDGFALVFARDGKKPYCKMDHDESNLSFTFQVGLMRDQVAIERSQLTLGTLKDLACSFINRKVS
jgi:hypothetical protein